jgi:dipeptidyl aminopeptidase/acylaminoacyl peptidase
LTGREIAHVYHDGYVTSVVFSPDGRYMVSTGGSSAIAWEAATGKEIMHMPSTGNTAFFTSDGRYVIIGEDTAASVWDVTTWKEISRIPHNTGMKSFALSPDGEYLLFRGNGDIVGLKWRTEDLIADACLRVTRNLTHEEWQQYIGDALPYQEICPNFSLEPTLMPMPMPTPSPLPTSMPTPTPPASPTP